MNGSVRVDGVGIRGIAVSEAVLNQEIVVPTFLANTAAQRCQRTSRLRGHKSNNSLGRVGLGPALGIHSTILALHVVRIARAVDVNDICVEELARLYGSTVRRGMGSRIRTLVQAGLGTKRNVERASSEYGDTHKTVGSINIVRGIDGRFS
jgi:hypothetical protein